MKKSILSIALIIAVCLSQITVFAGSTIDNAKVLYDMGLLKGSGSSFSEESLELTRNATRAEACTTIVRMLGKEAKANYQQNPHPFADVPQWASNNIGWLYENYLVNGVSDTYFGAGDIATVQQFATMLLRVLGFNDSEGDFSFNTAVDTAKNYGILNAAMANRYELSREDMINMCYNALILNIKNSNRKLIAKLCDEKAVNKQLAENNGLLKEPTLSDSFANIPENLGQITVINSGGHYRIKLATPAEEYGLRVYVKEDGGLMKEIPYYGDEYMQKGKISYPGGSAAGYVSDITVYGLDTSKTYSFIVIKTTSEGEFYQIVGKSTVDNA